MVKLDIALIITVVTSYLFLPLHILSWATQYAAVVILCLPEICFGFIYVVSENALNRDYMHRNDMIGRIVRVSDAASELGLYLQYG